ncbi:MAG TPA: hypothetical protein PLP73_00455 [Candidatus Absconditabacterales bacterium]|nr:hypothetical protein [Candidatus Absconditabacterales bacterium]HRU49888.1 hypothetical protein [Candidatus Absconditabacterales bacterium]
MKLKDYFSIKQENQISANDKFFIYEKIISQKNRKSFFDIKIFDFLSVKSFAYGFMMVVLLVGIYGIYFFNGDFSYEGFMVQNNTNLVTADYIAQVVEFNGDFYIKHDNNYYKTNRISNGDNVILKKGSEILFHTNSGTSAKINGPARFSLHKESTNYKLIISEGDFIKMESTSSSSDSMEIVLNDITISSEKNINLLVTKQKDEYQINNQGDKIVVKKDNKTQELQGQQLLAIKENDITLIKDVKDFEQAIIKQDISQTFAIVDDQAKDIDNIDDDFINEISSKNNDSTNLDLAQNLGLVDKKEIPSQSQTKELYSILYRESILSDLEGLYKNQLLGKQAEYHQYKGFLENKIQSLYRTFKLQYKEISLNSSIVDIREQLDNAYHIPSKYLSYLDTISNWVKYIQSLENGSHISIEEVDQLWDDLRTNPPSNLVFK